MADTLSTPFIAAIHLETALVEGLDASQSKCLALHALDQTSSSIVAN